MSRPVIGISAYREQARWGVWDQPAVLIPAAYVDQVSAAGGLPVVIPPSTALDPAVIDRLDGLLLAGGADLNPELYGQQPHAETAGWREDRDAGEVALLNSALERDLPVLGICRGLQVMTVHARGHLEQHLPDVVGHHDHRPSPGVFGLHEVSLVPGTIAHSVLGDSVTVKSYHHQGVADPGSLRIAGRGHDDTIEAVEIPGRTFALGVLWHPEAGDDPRLFDALVEAASGHSR
ncbi:MAG TPA: gamma-glutamyl-gamma-aminobutyrate hydrolase family protein [Actinomycetes bacterium]|nr:gamma-glutamyl-gamma-aminobutyrate hydrolase family protein [Actinomycetes bacterium]